MRKPKSSQEREVANSSTQRWTPPDFADHKQTRIGASVVEQFVSGHDASDVLRELVQNEFDGGGDKLVVAFDNDLLEVVGNGAGVSASGWKRLSVIVGTGRVVGTDADERVDAKTNGIGSKNFGLRSLFIFGDQIYVRSGGAVAVLDLKTLETGKVRDPDYWGGKGVRIQVPFRQSPFEMLEAFTAEREAVAFEVMASGMLAALVKLALPGRRPGLRSVTLQSERSSRKLEWRQSAESVPSPVKGVTVVRRSGRLIDTSNGEARRKEFEELEFSVSLPIPEEFRSLNLPSYFQAKNERVKISVSLPMRRRKLDFQAQGYFHYPLQAPDSATGCLVSVSAPFILDNDRSGLTDHQWNTWLLEQAADLAVDLVVSDWFKRFGASAFRALIKTVPGKPAAFIDRISMLLREGECWPTREPGKLAKAGLLVVPEDPVLDAFLPDSRYLERTLGEDEAVRDLAKLCGASTFTLGALVRLRCAGDDAKHLHTKLKKEEGDWRFTNHSEALREVDRQVHMAKSLSAMAKRLSSANRLDLSSTPSTLSAAGTLRPAKDLILVSSEIWDVSHEPMENRLHPDLASYRVIAGACRLFDEQTWIIEACQRATSKTITKAEQTALYARLMHEKADIGRAALAAVRKSPVLLNNRGEWAAADDMVHLKGAVAKLMEPVLQSPNKELLKAALMPKLRVRNELTGADLVAFAEDIEERPETADAFERLLTDNARLLTPKTRDALRSLPFLRSRTKSFQAPESLHLDTPLNRMIIGQGDAIVGGNNHELYRRLGVGEWPSVALLLKMLDDLSERSQRPDRPDLIYPALVEAMKREKRTRLDYQDREIIWWRGKFHAPNAILVGPRVPRVLDQHLPTMRKVDQVTVAALAMGAREDATDLDWTTFFTAVCGDWDRQQVSAQTARVLSDAYMALGSNGLPAGLDDMECLLTRDSYLYSPKELRAGDLMENDFPALADALDASEVDIGIVDTTDRTAAFFHRLRIRPLSSLAGAGVPVFGTEVRQPNWFKQVHDDRTLEMLRRPIFAKALHAIAWRRRHLLDDYTPLPLDELAVRLKGIEGIAFYETIRRGYRVGTAVVHVAVETAVNENLIGLVSPRTQFDFQQLLAQALAELTGATNVDLIRTLSTDMLPLVLARAPDEIVGWLERIGVFISGLGRLEDVPRDADFPAADDDAGEEVIRSVMNSLDIEPAQESAPATPPASVAPTAITPTVTPPPSRPPLPPIDEVNLSVEATSGATIHPATRSHGGGYGHGGWSPRTGTDVDGDREVGRRGEALVYRLEIERVRAQGHPNPEEVVKWTSLADPGADHDICSVDVAGNPRWIEVKSTSGQDGNFEWSRNEFEKAFRERERYELWRVYRAAGTDPVAKCFENPSSLIGAARLQLELSSLRATIEALA